MLTKRNVVASVPGKGTPPHETLLAATGLAVGLSSQSALAQDTPAAATDSGELVEIVVTGSRVARDGYQAPSPTNVISAEAIDVQGAAGLGEILEQTGMVKGTRNPNSNAANTANAAFTLTGQTFNPDGSIRNALDRDPVMTPYTVLNTPVYGAYYDKVGRQYSLGWDVRF